VVPVQATHQAGVLVQQSNEIDWAGAAGAAKQTTLLSVAGSMIENCDKNLELDRCGGWEYEPN